MILKLKMEINKIAIQTVDLIKKKIEKQEKKMIAGYGGDKTGPFLYIIVATGNIYEDVVQAVAGARQGADIIAVIRANRQIFTRLCTIWSYY